ncbi:multidrug transporter [Actinocatenispora thailandica]|uniref:Multidrug transporter n=1 Tax=Actinocatenispora thailandica TaxID=227318 RepID=A0A7R7HZ56_9ACTN|nr:DMT family transporter [Actinocatenispora thailandica]BCJ36773.1 multidrug transporter [Actinocatenispora thailandica]
MGIVLALCAAACYGSSDFLGGLLSRRASPYAVAVVAQCAALFVVAAVAAIAGNGLPAAAALAWGALSGIGNGLGTVFLYRGLGSARMSVVAPLSAVGSAGLPVLVGVAEGDRPAPLAVAGILLALPAVALISRGADAPAGPQPAAPAPRAAAVSGSASPAMVADPAVSGTTVPGPAGRPGSPARGPSAPPAKRRSGVVDGLLAGAGFALLFVALDRVPHDAGLWPLAAGQLVATGTILLAALLVGAALRLPARQVAPGASVGVLGGGATVLFVLATHRTLLSIAAVVTSLYPALTVLAAMLVLRERIGRGQAVGLAAAAGTVVLIALA